MQKEKSKFLDILFGTLTAVGVYVAGILMSGRLVFAVEIELYETGYAVLAFPFLFAIICILVGMYSVRKNRTVYFKASMISLVLPAIGSILIACLALLMNCLDNLGLPSDIFGYLEIVFCIFFVPLSSIFSKIYYALNEHAILSILFMAVPMLAGYIFAIVKYKIDRSKQNKSTE